MIFGYFIMFYSHFLLNLNVLFYVLLCFFLSVLYHQVKFLHTLYISDSEKNEYFAYIHNNEDIPPFISKF